MKNYIIYASLLVVGLGTGYLLFGTKDTQQEEEKEHDHSEHSEEIWTCSMHPQIRQPEPGDCPICGMDLILLEENANKDPLMFTMSEEAVKISNIQTTVIGSPNTTEKSLAISGKIKADETVASSLVTHFAGRIEKLYISYTGESVSKGQKIASIYSSKLITAQQELLEASQVKQSNPKLYDAAYNKLKYWKLSDKQIESIITSTTVLETFDVYADFSGVVKTKKVSVGDYVKEGEVLFDVQSLSKVWAVFDVYETDVANVKMGDEITFTTTSYPNDKFTAKISFIDPVIDPVTRTIAVRANVSNAHSRLKPEMFINGHIAGGANANSQILVPKSAVLWTGKQSVVYLKKKDHPSPSFEYRKVEIGEAIGDSYALVSGLKAGDEVVTNGAFVIDASAQLNNQASMMNQHLVEGENTTTEVSSEPLKDNTKFKVYGNCGMCKETIEGSLIGQEGIGSVDWNKESKMILVNFDSEVISEDQMKEKIASVGYDTETHKADDGVYDALPGCCKYDRP